MRIIAVIIAVGALLLGWMAMAMPNARQPVFGAILIGYGVVTLLLAACASAAPVGNTVLKWFLIVTTGLTVIAYALPQSFWRLVGLRD